MTRRGGPDDRPDRRPDSGAGSVLVVSVIMVVLTALVASAALAAGYTARRQAAAAADLAAIAGAQAVSTGVDPCDRAGTVAGANGASLRSCVVDGFEVEVEVQVPVRRPFDWLPEPHRRARAGPASGW